MMPRAPDDGKIDAGQVVDGGDMSTMRIRGTAFLSKKNQIVRHQGEPAWDAFAAKLRVALPYFDQVVLASTLIPVSDFLAFQDLMLDHFYGGDLNAYWLIGSRSADWALVDGPYKSFLRSRDVATFVARFPQLWHTYFTESDVSATYDDGVVEVKATGLPVWHGYFEYMVMGYLRRALELLGVKVSYRVMTAPRTRDYHYRFLITE